MAMRGVRLAYYTLSTPYSTKSGNAKSSKTAPDYFGVKGIPRYCVLITRYYVNARERILQTNYQAIEEKCGGKTDEIERVAWARYHVPKSRHWALIGRQFLISQLCVHHGDSQRTD